jgi:thymidylate kinase
MNVDCEGEQPRPELASLLLPEFAGRAGSRPFVLALEGPNGAGKTTLCQTLARSLGARRCLGTDEAWFSEAFKTRMIRDADWFSSAMFFLSGCFEQMRALRGQPDPLVIMDRSLWSTFAVQAAESTGRLRTLLDMLRPVAAEIQVPDLTIVLEATFETCQERIARKSGTARLLDNLTATPGFHAGEREFYRWLGRQRCSVIFLDVNDPNPDSVAERALQLIRERPPHSAPAP